LFTLEVKVGAVHNNYMTRNGSYRNEICQTYSQYNDLLFGALSIHLTVKLPKL